MNHFIQFKLKCILISFFDQSLNFLEDPSFKNLKFNWNLIESTDPQYYLSSMPAGFMWGAATSAHKVEGHNSNQWTYYERKFAGVTLAAQSGQAADHWDLDTFKADVDRAKQLGINTYHMSVEWSRIEPKRGVYSQSALNHYRDMLLYLYVNDIKTVVSLFDYTMPVWVYNTDHFLNQDNVKQQVEQCDTFSTYVGDIIEQYITFNDINRQALDMFLIGNQPNSRLKMGINNQILFTQNVLNAHNNCYSVIKSNTEHLKNHVGLSLNFMQFETIEPYSFFQRTFFRSLNHLFRGIWLDQIQSGQFRWLYYKYSNHENSFDFIGINYFNRIVWNVEKCGLNQDSLRNIQKCSLQEFEPGEIITDYQDFQLQAEGINRSLNEARILQIPILITSTGIADKSDNKRMCYLKRVMYSIKRYIELNKQTNGQEFDHKLIGLIYYSLIDGFEWELGQGLKYGLIEIDFNNGQRKMRGSSQLQSDIIRYSQGDCNQNINLVVNEKNEEQSNNIESQAEIDINKLEELLDSEFDREIEITKRFSEKFDLTSD